MTPARVIAGLVIALALSGCAATRMGGYGPLGNGQALVTLVVSEDRTVVAQHCEPVRASGTVLGCQISWPAVLEGGRRARSVKVVRYTDLLPSALAFEIDIHELCHTVATLQAIPDPCHAGNDGVAGASHDGGAAMVLPVPEPRLGERPAP